MTMPTNSDILKSLEQFRSEMSRTLTYHGEGIARIDEHLRGLNGTVGEHRDDIKTLFGRCESQERKWSKVSGVSIGLGCIGAVLGAYTFFLKP